MTDSELHEIENHVSWGWHDDKGNDDVQLLINEVKRLRAVATEAREKGRKEGIEEMRPGIEAVEGLINNSHGVDGLHLNGDIAPWDELRTGGVYMEWLREFDHALELLKEKE